MAIRPALAGFTLLEMLLVLFVIGLMAGLIGPRFGARVEHIERQSRMKEIEDQLRQLPRRARLSGRSIVLPKDMREELADGEPALQLPEGWSIHFEPPLLVAAIGACSASRVTLIPPEPDEGDSQAGRYNIAELTCEIKPIAE